ncbi:MAG: hypothetical protein LUG96_15510 [Tannerellaceae bacterium]|nr:hypothetical protein [Tannerellaceae bacterium]
MLNFLTVPLIVGIICAGIYGLFELFVRKNEWLAIIKKTGDKSHSLLPEGKPCLSQDITRFSFSSLKAGCLLTRIGLGLLVGFIINTSLAYSWGTGYGQEWNRWFHSEMAGTAYGASVLFFGGIGLIVAFVIELKLSKTDKDSAEQQN